MGYDKYSRMARAIGNDFTRDTANRVELFKFKCKCGFEDVKEGKTLQCSCGKQLEGTLVYKKVGKNVLVNKL